jgi:acetyltransferase-like isoleucine patch superfamily enzyme
MKKMLTYIIRKRNPQFYFHPELNNAAIIQFTWIQLMSLTRGMKWMFFLKSPRWAMHGKKISVFNPSRISFGKFLRLGDHVYLSALGKEGIQFGSNVSIGAFSRVIVSTTLNNPGSKIKLGDRVGIGEFAYLGGAGGLTIGSDCIIGQYFSCHPENHHFNDPETFIRLQGVSRKGIVIGNNCWIGSKVTILDNVTIGEGYWRSASESLKIKTGKNKYLTRN